MEDLVEKLKSAVTVDLIQPMAGAADHEPPGFNVGVTFDNPQLAQQICQEITSAFMEQNATLRITNSNKVSLFLTQQLDDAKTKLEEQDRKLAEFKAQHLVSMPEQEQTNLALVGRDELSAGCNDAGSFKGARGQIAERDPAGATRSELESFTSGIAEPGNSGPGVSGTAGTIFCASREVYSRTSGRH